MSPRDSTTNIETSFPRGSTNEYIPHTRVYVEGEEEEAAEGNWCIQPRDIPFWNPRRVGTRSSGSGSRNEPSWETGGETERERERRTTTSSLPGCWLPVAREGKKAHARRVRPVLFSLYRIGAAMHLRPPFPRRSSIPSN